MWEGIFLRGRFSVLDKRSGGRGQQDMSRIDICGPVGLDRTIPAMRRVTVSPLCRLPVVGLFDSLQQSGYFDWLQSQEVYQHMEALLRGLQ